MNTKTGILALGLFTLTGVVVVSCGGSSDSGDTSTGGTTSTSGNGTGGSVSGNTSGGTANNTSGTANNTSGTANNTSGTDTGGTANGGTNNNNNAGANNNNNAGAPDNAGGAGNGMPGCPATAPADGSACMRVQNMAPFCSYNNNATFCTCQRAGGNQMRQWQCNDITQGAAGAGAGGAPGGFGQATCPANGMTGDDCSNGPGLCAGQRCFCGNNDMLTCF